MRESDLNNQAKALVRQILDLQDQRRSPIVAIDGRAASGKTTLAKLIKDDYFKSELSALRVIHMDDLYPGWEGLRAGSAYLYNQILLPISSGKTAHWQIWNWETSQRGNESEPGNGWREFSPGVPLVIEGCGSISRLSRGLIDLGVWLEVPTEVRKGRWEQREGRAGDKFWPIWQAQEDEFYQSERSESLADTVLG